MSQMFAGDGDAHWMIQRRFPMQRQIVIENILTHDFAFATQEIRTRMRAMRNIDDQSIRLPLCRGETV